jgi:hypothetical protein
VMSNLRMICESEKCGISPLDQKMQVDRQIWSRPLSWVK